MRKYRFERFVEGYRARLRLNEKNVTCVTVANVPGPLAFVEFVLEDDRDQLENDKWIKDIIIPDKIDVRFLKQGLKIYRHLPIKVKTFQSLVSRFIECLRERIALSINVTFETVTKLCDIAEEIETTDTESNEAKTILKLLLLQMLPERTEKLKLILKHCPISKMSRYARCSVSNVDWNPDVRDLTRPFDFHSMLSGDRKPTNDVQRLALDMWITFSATENALSAKTSKPEGLLAVLRNGINAQFVDLLVQNGVAQLFYSFQDDSKCWVTTPALLVYLNRFWRAYDAWNNFPPIDNWDKLLRGKQNLIESCLVLCRDNDRIEEIRRKIPNLVTADTLLNASAALDRLPCKPVTVILYKFDLWTFRNLLHFLPLLESKRIKDTISFQTTEILPLQYTDLALSSKVIDVIYARDGKRIQQGGHVVY